MEKLTDREVDVMMAIWNSTYDPVPTGDILRYINRMKKSSLQTLQVVLRRLCEKGVISCEKGVHTNLYRPLITEEEYIKFSEINFIAYHYHGSVGACLRYMFRNQLVPLSPEDRQELLKLLADMEESAEGD